MADYVSTYMTKNIEKVCCLSYYFAAWRAHNNINCGLPSIYKSSVTLRKLAYWHRKQHNNWLINLLSDFMKGSGTFTIRLRVMAKDKYIYVELKGENKTTFEGKTI